MKTITVRMAQRATDIGEPSNPLLTAFEIEGTEEMEASDGYHTFGELYEHRIELWIAYLREVVDHRAAPDVWRSRFHSDGSFFDGWFLLGMGFRSGQQMTYHLPLKYWERTSFVPYTMELAPKYDGHTSQQVIERLRG